MTLSYLRPFVSFREVVFAFVVLGLVGLVNVGLRYNEYRDFMHENRYFQGIVAICYEKTNKKGRVYQVAKIVTNDETIYTTFWKKSKYVKASEVIKFKISKKSISFLDFFSRKFFAPIYKVTTKRQKSFKNSLEVFIKSQHKSIQMQELYSALFLATPIGKELRKSIQHWGVSHLVAISGFHLGVMFSVLYFLLKFPYSFFQNRYFPYRNIFFDLSVIIFILLGFYMYMIDFAPSFLRAYVMGVLGFLFYVRHFKVLSFINLALAVCMILAFFPHLILSISFWFSVMGVYFIFLYIHHFSFKWWDMIFVNIWVFLAMMVPVHVWFGYTSLWQFGAIALSMVFVLFYPFAFLLHGIQEGDLLDGVLGSLLDVSLSGSDVFTPVWVFVCYIFLSLASIFNRYLAIFTICLGFIYIFIA